MMKVFIENQGTCDIQLRDYFASQIISFEVSQLSNTKWDNDRAKAAAEFAYKIADAMLEARK